MEFTVDLRGVEEVKIFANKAGKYDCDIMVKNRGRVFTVDGASIMGMFSLDLMEPVIVHIEDEETGKIFRNDVAEYVIEGEE